MSIALAILGVERGGKTLCYTKGGWNLSASFTVAEKILSEPPNLPLEIDPLEPSIKAGGWTFSIQADQTETELWFKTLNRADGFLWETVSKTTTTIKLVGESIPSFTTIYMGRETIELGTNTGGTTVTHPDTGASVTYYTYTSCTRAAFGSQAQSHIGDSWESSYYLDAELSSRPVLVKELLPDGSVRDRYGFIFAIRELIEDADSGAIIEVEVRGALATAISRKMNAEPYAFGFVDDLVYSKGLSSPSEVVYQGIFDASTQRRILLTEDAGQYTTATGYGQGLVPVQIGNILTHGVLTNDGSGISCRQLVLGGTSGANFLGSPLEPKTDRDIILKHEGVGYELFCWGEAFYDLEGNYYGSARELVGTSYEDYMHHVGTCLLAVLCSTGYGYNGDFDILGQGMGLEVPVDMVDVAGIMAWVEANPDYTLYSLIKGAGGASYGLMELVSETLLPYFALLTEDDDGKITVKKLTVVGEADVTVDCRDIVAFSQVHDRQLESSAQTVKGTFGLFWQDEATITTRNLGRQARLWWPNDESKKRSKVSMSLSAFPRPNAQGQSPWIAALDYYLQWTRAEIPTYVFRMAQYRENPLTGVFTNNTVYPGQTLEIDFTTKAWPTNSDGSRGRFIGKDGTRIYADSLKGFVRSVTPNRETMELEVELWAVNNPLVLDPVPIPWSFKVASSTSTSTIVIDRFYGGKDALDYLNVESPYVQCAEEDLTPFDWSLGTSEIQVILVSSSATTITLLTTAGSPSSTIPVGTWLRFVDRDSSNISTGQAGYLYLTDDDGTIDTSTTTIEGDKWL